MIAYLFNKSTGKGEKKKYPRKDNIIIPDLDKNLEWYELKYAPRPVINEMQYYLREYVERGDVIENTLPIATVNYAIEQLGEAIVITNLNNSVGRHIDASYPQWEQSKHAGKSLRFLYKLQTGQLITEEETKYITYIQTLADWVSECRELRDLYENEFLTTGTLPEVIWPERPLKQL